MEMSDFFRLKRSENNKKDSTTIPWQTQICIYTAVFRVERHLHRTEITQRRSNMKNSHIYYHKILCSSFMYAKIFPLLLFFYANLKFRHTKRSKYVRGSCQKFRNILPENTNLLHVLSILCSRRSRKFTKRKNPVHFLAKISEQRDGGKVGGRLDVNIVLCLDIISSEW